MCLKMNWFFSNKFCENITIHYIIQDEQTHRTLTFNTGKSNLSSHSSLQWLHYGRVICITLAKLKHLSSAKDRRICIAFTQTNQREGGGGGGKSSGSF